MKKIVGILISVIAVLSVVIVAFVGTQAVGIEPVIYISSVQILDMNSHGIDPANKTLEVPFKADAVDGSGNSYMFYVFNAIILPETSTSRSILYYCPTDPYFSFVSGTAVSNSSSSSGAATTLGESQTSRSGQLLVKKMDRKDPAKPVYHVLQIHLKADDNGTAPEDSIYFVVKY
ncbi:MAG: hypothetical protein WCS90_05420 [Bacilli bacterium]